MQNENFLFWCFAFILLHWNYFNSYILRIAIFFFFGVENAVFNRFFIWRKPEYEVSNKSKKQNFLLFLTVRQNKDFSWKTVKKDFDSHDDLNRKKFNTNCLYFILNRVKESQLSIIKLCDWIKRKNQLNLRPKKFSESTSRFLNNSFPIAFKRQPCNH